MKNLNITFQLNVPALVAIVVVAPVICQTVMAVARKG